MRPAKSRRFQRWSRMVKADQKMVLTAVLPTVTGSPVEPDVFAFQTG